MNENVGYNSWYSYLHIRNGHIFNSSWDWYFIVWGFKGKEMVEKYRRILEQRKGEKRSIENNISQCQKDIESFTIQRDNTIKARWVMSEVAKRTQQRFSTRIEELVTMLLVSVFNRPFHFLVDFVIQRNKPECRLLVYEGPEKTREEMLEEAFVPDEEMGGGSTDVIAFGLRVVLWSMENPRSRNVLILDEPGRFTGALVSLFGKMIKTISQELNLQIIMATHEEALIDIADRSFRVTYDGKISHVEQLGQEKEESEVKEEQVKPKRFSRRT